MRFTRGAADMAGFDSRSRSLNVYGTYDLDAAAGAVEGSIRPQVIGWYVLAGLAALAALAVIAQAMARQAAYRAGRSPGPVGAGRAAPRAHGGRPGSARC